MFANEPLPAAFTGLQPRSPDPLLEVSKAFRADPRHEKIDLGIGIYRTASGETPVLQAVKAAERRLVEDQTTKAYVGTEGDVDFLDALTPIVFGGAAAPEDLVALQTPGGTGALRMAAELIAAGGGSRRLWLGTPSWPIHQGIFRQAGLEVVNLAYFDAKTQTIGFERYLEGLGAATPGDVVLLHGACHNPTGADLSLEQWTQVADLVTARGAIPLIDLAYHGLGDGLAADVAGLQAVMGRCETVIVAQSCDKNFGLYRERTGALFVRTSPAARELVRTNLMALARSSWSMPPDHGAAIVRIILQSETLAGLWRQEIDEMRQRLNGLRSALAEAAPQLRSLRRQRGLFALLPLEPAAVEALRRDHAIYMAGSGRINIAGLAPHTLAPFACALSNFL